MKENKGRFVKGHHLGMKGKHHTEETKIKMSAVFKGRKLPEETKVKIRKSMMGKHNGWKGGKTNNYEYVLIWKPDHPYSSRVGYVLEHRLVAERELGRYLRPSEKMHHRNGKRGDNKWENLFVFESQSDHMRYERFLRRKPRQTQIL